jgi:DNA polymerase
MPRVAAERDGPPVEELIGGRRSIQSLAEAAAGCRACRLWRDATQTVFGDGPARATVVLVGEQPGDREDLAGEPFVGPAGKLLDRALDEAGIDRRTVYVTNVVKHFKFDRSGKRRIHKKPNTEEIGACRPWLDAELRTLKPSVVVCLGATAAQALLGRTYRVTQERGRFVQKDGTTYTSTVHPSSILRAPDDASRHEATQRFVADLKQVAKKIAAARKTA